MTNHKGDVNDAEPLIWTVYMANDEFPLGVVLKFQRHTLQTFFSTQILYVLKNVHIYVSEHLRHMGGSRH